MKSLIVLAFCVFPIAVNAYPTDPQCRGAMAGPGPICCYEQIPCNESGLVLATESIITRTVCEWDDGTYLMIESDRQSELEPGERCEAVR